MRAVDLLLGLLLLVMVLALTLTVNQHFTTETVHAAKGGDIRIIERKNAFGQKSGRQEIWVGEQLHLEAEFHFGDLVWKKRHVGDHIEFTYENPDYTQTTEIWERGVCIGRSP